MSTPLTDRIEQEHAAAVGALAPAVRARRRRALEQFLARGLPTGRDENWRYANLRPLERVRFAPVPQRTAIGEGQLPAPIAGYARFAFIDGLWLPDLSHAGGTHGVSVRARSSVRPGAEAAAAEAAGGEAAGRDAAGSDAASPASAASAEGAFALLNAAFAPDGAEIAVEDGQQACIELVFAACTPAQQAASYPALRLRVGRGAHLSLIERHVSVGNAASFVDAAVQAHIGERASVDHYRVQQLSAESTWLDTLAAEVQAGASYRLHAVSLGALSARSTLTIALAGERAELVLDAVAVGRGRQVHDAYALVEHQAAHTRTDERFRGIAAARSRLAFNGKIVVRPQARGADSTQSLRGLLAGGEAEIDVRPQLEIYTDEVRCSHGATAGKLDEGMLFYLLSRGIDRDTARRLLEWAFLEDVVARIAVAELRRAVELALAGQMQEGEALKELL